MKQSEQMRQMAEKTWLGYFNNLLYEREIITETERNKLALRIDRSEAGSKRSASNAKS